MSVAAGKQQKKTWSLAAAARAARQARIAAVRYMREAAIEREWQAAVLSYGHQARAAHSDNPDGARALLFATMGYRPPYPGWDQASAMMLADEAQYLAGADLYVLTPQMLDVVIAAAQPLTFADLALLRDDDLPSPSGTVILPRPLITRSPSGSWHQDIAFTWQSPSQVPLPPGIGFGRAELPAVRMSGYTTAARPSRGFTQAARAQRVALPPMLLDVIWSLPLHPGIPGQAHDDYDHLAAALRQLNNAYWQDEARNREAGDLGQAAGEYASGAVLDQDPDGTLGSRFLYAFWRLCEQQIGAIQAAPAGHSAQVTGARAGVNPDVRVVALRRAGPSGRPAAQAGPHQWHHHWVVRMHKVRQWYPSLQQHKVIYRGPFVKGDMAKPLLAGEVVRGLVK